MEILVSVLIVLATALFLVLWFKFFIDLFNEVEAGAVFGFVVLVVFITPRA